MSETKYLIAHARANEYDTASGGYAGDQTGFELNAINWYSNGWDIVYRPKDEEKAEMIASFMEKAVANGFIGYSQASEERGTLFTLCSGNGFKPELINSPCSCDCSSLVYTALYSAYKVVYGNNEIPTVNAFESFIDTTVKNFSKFTADEYLTGPDSLKRGDILIATDLHIAVWI